jgi:hypothetical protein
MKSKKAQQDIIITVLLILIALAAVSAIAYFIVNQVKTGANQATDKAECLKVTLAIDKVNVTGTSHTLYISRGSDDINLKDMNVYVNGVLSTTKNIALPGKLEKKYGIAQTATLSVGNTVRINAVLQSGYVCENGAEATAV